MYDERLHVLMSCNGVHLVVNIHGVIQLCTIIH